MTRGLEAVSPQSLETRGQTGPLVLQLPWLGPMAEGVGLSESPPTQSSEPESDRSPFPTPWVWGGSRRSLLLLSSFLVRVTDDLPATKPNGQFQVPILLDPSASLDTAGLSLISETLLPPLWSVEYHSSLVLACFADHALLVSAGSSSSPHCLCVDPQGSVRLHPLSDFISPHGLMTPTLISVATISQPTSRR